jgi:hypothetical protein
MLLRGFVSPGFAQPATRQIVPVPFNDNTPVALSIAMDQQEPRIGSMVAICFRASRAGFATLWNISTTGTVSRVFPNSLQTAGSTSQIEAERRVCAGVTGDPFRFRVDGPPGTEDLYLLWTSRADLQPSRSDYADADALVGAMRQLGNASNADWAASKLTYDIVPSTGPVLPVLPPSPPQSRPPLQDPSPPPPQARRGAIFILAMGANVGQLTKSNQDAALFTRTVMELLDVPRDHVRFVANATHADFAAGIQWLRTEAQPQDIVFVYFSGHGGRFRSTTSDDGWDEFMVPYDFARSGASPRNLVFSQEFASWVNAIPTNNVVAAIDTCFSAGVFRSIEAGVLGARNKSYTLPPEAESELVAARPAATRSASGPNRIKAHGVLFAAAHRDQSALEGSQGSFFTLALAQELRSKPGATLADAFARSVILTQRITNNRQQPEAVGDMTIARQIVLPP